MAEREPVEIFGKDGCPYTEAARRDYAGRGVPVTYLDVKRDAAAMTRFLELSGGERRVPLILDRGRVSIGFGGS